MTQVENEARSEISNFLGVSQVADLKLELSMK